MHRSDLRLCREEQEDDSTLRILHKFVFVTCTFRRWTDRQRCVCDVYRDELWSSTCLFIFYCWMSILSSPACCRHTTITCDISKRFSSLFGTRRSHSHSLARI